MKFKSGKYLTSTFSKVLSGAALGAVALIPVSSWATITPTPVTPSITVTLPNFFNNSYYYPAFSSSQSGSLGAVVGQFGTIDLVNGFAFVDLGADADQNSGFGAGNPGVIYFNIFSSNTSFSQAAAIGVYTGGTQTGTATQLLPIASFNQEMCGNGDGGNCLAGFNRGGTFGNYFYGVNYSAGQTVTIGLDVQSICRSFRVGSADVPPICNSQLLNNSATQTSGTPFLINFAIFNQQDIINLGNATNTTPVPGTQDGPAQVSLIFNTLPGAPIAPVPSPAPSPTPTPTALCNLAEGVAIAQDSGIQIDSTRFSIAGEPGVTGPGAVIAVGNLSLDNNLADSTVNDQSLNYTTGNSVQTAYFAPGNLFVFGGMQDSTSTETFNYRIGFLVRDYAGFVFDDHSGNNSGSCTFPNFYSTSQIQGFLNQNKCFIATAAFRMGNDGPIRLLREFRDRFLEQFGLGQSFVHWYYSWSPGAADWLIDHPVFRFPVLLALIPLQMVAWTILHPMVLGLLALLAVGLGMGLFLNAVISRARQQKEGTL